MTTSRPPLEALDVIIPVLNGGPRLAETLKALPPVHQVIVVDGGSTDGSEVLAAAHGASILSSAPARGGQLALGAEASTAPWLLFLHADTRLDNAAWAAVAAYVTRPDAGARAAVFRLKLDDPAWQARVLERAVRLRVALLSLPYGDQGLLIHRDLYAAIGGFATLPLMEDVDLVRRLGRRRLCLLDGTAETSAERWRRRGWIRQTARNLRCLALYFLGVPPTRIATLYGR
ncbi:TIGR04283 family arsenosugar biosynthesis glycosyltransferase [uncultured Brevundimonas sp.]|uniref:TIGR04283 family arsenosugar biosynthesis glycosyltransferase n=1 Tax=uncultured Brevundimonas sp. TaxID=213418 RepID=UPI0030EBCB19|tara:strand:+ start:160100 stop:160792 length:693 start_codon:yes stop_codon:yes gene_type:complete